MARFALEEKCEDTYLIYHTYIKTTTKLNDAI